LSRCERTHGLQEERSNGARTALPSDRNACARSFAVRRTPRSGRTVREPRDTRTHPYSSGSCISRPVPRGLRRRPARRTSSKSPCLLRSSVALCERSVPARRTHLQRNQDRCGLHH
jgi:hypothetical protein